MFAIIVCIQIPIKQGITSGSPFNIKAKSLRLDDFDEAEITTLYHQHTQDTGQKFADGVIPLVWELTQGQPWLVNALGYEVCFETKVNRDRTKIIALDMIKAAREKIIQRRETHLDQLVDKLQETRVQRVISPMLQGFDFDKYVQQDDIQYVMDLGLIKRTATGLHISNPIYQEVLPRALSYTVQLNLESHIQPQWYITPEGLLDVDKLMEAFQQFFRQNSEIWVERFDYKEAGPQLLMQAFLQRIMNRGGQIEREYGLGRGRTDLLLIWPYGNNHPQQVVIELKIRYKSLANTIETNWFKTNLGLYG